MELSKPARKVVGQLALDAVGLEADAPPPGCLPEWPQAPATRLIEAGEDDRGQGDRLPFEADRRLSVKIRLDGLQHLAIRLADLVETDERPGGQRGGFEVKSTTLDLTTSPDHFSGGYEVTEVDAVLGR
jgi:hypothetical protein